MINPLRYIINTVYIRYFCWRNGWKIVNRPLTNAQIQYGLSLESLAYECLDDE